MKKQELLDRKYTAEELADVEEDVLSALGNIDAEVDKHGFFPGEVRVHITYKVRKENKN